MIELDDGTGGTFPAYRSDPLGNAKGALVVIHEIWGLADHIKEVADRFAAEGYLVVASDILSKAGIDAEAGRELQALIFSADEAERNKAQPLMREKFAPSRSPEYAEWATGALTKVVDYLAEQPGVEGRIGVAGFCFGGTYSFALAAADSRVRASVPFYGHPPETAKVADIACPLLAFYGDQDANLMSSLDDVKAAMAAAGVDFTAQVYEGAGHAFFNDTNATMYRADAAADAWQRTLDFLSGQLSA